MVYYTKIDYKNFLIILKSDTLKVSGFERYLNCFEYEFFIEFFQKHHNYFLFKQSGCFLNIFFKDINIHDFYHRFLQERANNVIRRF